MRNVLILCVAILFAGCDSADPVPSNRSNSSSGSVAAAVTKLADPQDVDVSVDEPNGSRPVAVGAAFDRQQASPGDVVTLVVRSKMADPWHIYAAEGPTGVGRPTKIELTLPAGVSESSERTLPEATTKESTFGPVASYHGDVRFAVPLKLGDEIATGPVEVRCQFDFQACTDAQCLPPSSVSLAVPLEIISR